MREKITAWLLNWVYRDSGWVWTGGSWERSLADIRGNRRGEQEWAEYREWKASQ